MPGIPVSDLWIDIPPVQGLSKENTGFLTQKPESLVTRIVESASKPGDLVADFFAGSGTTAVAAIASNRRWILCDSSQAAITVISDRIGKVADGSSYIFEDI
ncbi:MAG: DNA methyltransferase [Candidatus Thorarchaeota archaeon]